VKTLQAFDYNGETALEDLLVKSEYGCIEQAVASLTLFTHPATVVQTKNAALFRIRRYRAGQERGDILLQ